MLEKAVKEPYELADFVDAEAQLFEEVGEDNFDDEKCVIECPFSAVVQIKKSLGLSLKYVEQHIKSYYVGTVLGMPIYYNKEAENVSIKYNK